MIRSRARTAPGSRAHPSRRIAPTRFILTPFGRLGGALALLTVLLPAGGPVRAADPPWVLGFDEVPAGTPLNEVYAARGVHIRSFGDGLVGTVIADTACVQASSAPNVLSPNGVGGCPSYRENVGWVRVTFDLPQPRVSVRVTNVGNGVASYLRAFRGAALLEMVFGQTGPAWNGVAQTLQIQRPVGHPLIDFVEIGAFRDSDPIEVDDISYDVRPVPADQRSWGALKARYP